MIKKNKTDQLKFKIVPCDINPDALFIIKKLNHLGFDAFLVGGCIRDLILGRTVLDWDIVTEASIEQTIKIFKDYKIIMIGKKYGTIILLMQNHLQYQISTFKSKEGKQPGLQSDLKCRDFTLNSLAWNEQSGLIDVSKGIEDIRFETIRFNENGVDRIKEDPLRMLRAIRLACQLNFKIEDSAIEKINEYSKLLQNVSVERIRDEFTKILLSDLPAKGLKLLYQMNLLQFIMPELQANMELQENDFLKGQKSQGNFIESLDNLPSAIILRLSMLIFIVSSKIEPKEKKLFINKVLRRIRFKNKIIEKINLFLSENIVIDHFVQKKDIRQLASRIGLNNLKDFWALYKTISLSTYLNEKNLESKMKIGEKNLKETLKENPPVCIQDLEVNGKDLLELGYKEGPEIRNNLNRLLKSVIEKPEINQKETLLEIVSQTP